MSEPTVRVNGPLGPTSSHVSRECVLWFKLDSERNERDSQRVKSAESRGQKRQGEDAQELEANAEEQHFDADVDLRASRTCREGDVRGDAAGASSEEVQTKERSVNSSLSSKTEVFQMIVESLLQCKGVEGFNDNEVMEFCIRVECV